MNMALWQSNGAIEAQWISSAPLQGKLDHADAAWGGVKGKHSLVTKQDSDKIVRVDMMIMYQ